MLQGALERDFNIDIYTNIYFFQLSVAHYTKSWYHALFRIVFCLNYCYSTHTEVELFCQIYSNNLIFTVYDVRNISGIFVWLLQKPPAVKTLKLRGGKSLRTEIHGMK